MKRYTLYMPEACNVGTDMQIRQRTWERKSSEFATFLARGKPVMAMTNIGVGVSPVLWQEPLTPYEIGCASEADFTNIVAEAFVAFPRLNYLVLADHDSFKTVVRPPEADSAPPGVIDLMFSHGAV